MFFYASKILTFFILPTNLLAFLVLAGILLMGTKWHRVGRTLALLGGGLLVICGLTPLGNVLILPLEERFPAQKVEQLTAPHGIIVLGGGIDAGIANKRNTVAITAEGERVTEFVSLAHDFKDATKVFASGSWTIFYEKVAESNALRKFYKDTGLDTADLYIERASRNTYEAAMFTRELVKPQPDQKWLLITSAHHMPRAIGCFRKAGFDIVALPVDYRTRGQEDYQRFFGKMSEGLRLVDIAAREWIGLFAYYLTNRTPNMFPAPK